MSNGIQFRMVVKSTCLNNMYHYRYQERTPNIRRHNGDGKYQAHLHLTDADSRHQSWHHLYTKPHPPQLVTMVELSVP